MSLSISCTLSECCLIYCLILAGPEDLPSSVNSSSRFMRLGVWRPCSFDFCLDFLRFILQIPWSTLSRELPSLTIVPSGQGMATSRLSGCQIMETGQAGHVTPFSALPARSHNPSSHTSHDRQMQTNTYLALLFSFFGNWVFPFCTLCFRSSFLPSCGALTDSSLYLYDCVCGCRRLCLVV